MSSALKRCIAVVVWFGVVVSVFVLRNVATEAKSTSDYHETIAAEYDFRFGTDRPFAPGNATTHDGKFIDSKEFVTSERCASCHKDIHPQWSESAHAKAFEEPFYQKNVRDLQERKNIAFTRHCESCHNPAALFSGALTDQSLVVERPFDREGVSCIVCHSIESVNGKGIGGYVMGQPALLQLENGTKISNASDQEILDNTEGHKRAMMRDLLKKPEFCAACHKSQVPKELNDYKFQRAFAVGDEYQQSSFSKESPHPYYEREKETCNSCHMSRVAAEKFDVSAKNETVVSHRFAAANTAIPMVYGFKKQFEETVRFLQDDKIGIDIFAISKNEKDSRRSKIEAPLDRSRIKFKPGDVLTADVVITNKNIGHSFPPELRDFYEAFIEFTVDDDKGRVYYKSGFIKPDGELEEAAHNYKTYLLFENGKLNDLHHIWDTKVIGQNNQIHSGRSDLARYRFVVPDGVRGGLILKAQVKYRRFTRRFSDYVFGKPENLPIVSLASATESIGDGSSSKTGGRANSADNDWRRWNNYGIALMDNKKYLEADSAFSEVASYRNAYRGRAYTNRALALIMLGDWKGASAFVDRSLSLDPKDYRALFQRGRLLRITNKLDEANEAFSAVLKIYPRDRNTLQELGELAKLKSENLTGDARIEELNTARKFFERKLSVDPEDVAAIYNLMLVFQKLGDQKRGREMSELYRDMQVDTQAAFITDDFLQSNPDVYNESRPFHVHDLKPFDISDEYSSYPSAGDIDWKRVLKTTADFNEAPRIR